MLEIIKIYNVLKYCSNLRFIFFFIP